MKKLEQNFIYHCVPKDLAGDTLKPLFALKEYHPNLFENAILKYSDHPKRKNLPNKLIPKLNCRRGDVLHCSSIHPHLVYLAYKEIFTHSNFSLNFFKIPLKDISHLKLCYFDMNREGYEFGLEKDPEHAFDLIDASTYNEFKYIPVEAVQFYKDWKSQGQKGAPLWGKIPHVFVQGEININGLDVFDWKSVVL